MSPATSILTPSEARPPKRAKRSRTSRAVRPNQTLLRAAHGGRLSSRSARMTRRVARGRWAISTAAAIAPIRRHSVRVADSVASPRRDRLWLGKRGRGPFLPVRDRDDGADRGMTESRGRGEPAAPRWSGGSARILRTATYSGAEVQRVGPRGADLAPRGPGATRGERRAPRSGQDYSVGRNARVRLKRSLLTTCVGMSFPSARERSVGPSARLPAGQDPREPITAVRLPVPPGWPNRGCPTALGPYADGPQDVQEPDPCLAGQLERQRCSRACQKDTPCDRMSGGIGPTAAPRAPAVPPPR
jgi:hypothetical protein